MNIYLQIFLLVDVFLIGLIAATATRHWLAHFRPASHDAERTHPIKPEPLTLEAKKQMQERAQANFQAVIDRSASDLQTELRASEGRLVNMLEKLGANIVEKEMDRYHEELDKLRQRAETADKGAEDEIVKHQADLKAKIEQELAADKQRKIAQLDTKIADAITSFLLETLGHDVDLGAQNKYLLAQLDAHKTEILQGVADAS